MNFSDYENVKFEDALRELEDIVSKLENQTAKLDESLEFYEKGIFLVKLCSKMLDEAEQKVSILSRDQEGNVVLKDFVADVNA